MAHRVIVSINKCLLLALLACSLCAGTRLLRQPAYHSGKVAFIYQNDLWVAEESGANPRRLTVTKAAEQNPRFSPDGRWIAYHSAREGYSAVFVMPAAGGDSRQVTFSGSSDRVAGWTPDGRKILLTSSRGVGFGGTETLWEVPLEGGLEKQVLPDRAAWASYSPDMTKLAYNRHRSQGYRKHYRGSAAADLWVLDCASGTYKELADPSYKGGSRAWPMYGRDGFIYFVADPTATEKPDEVMKSVNNIWKVSQQGGKAVQVTRHMSGNLFNPTISEDRRTIVYEENFGVWKLDLASGKAVEIVVNIPEIERESPVENVVIDSTLDAFDLSPSTRRAAISARGRLFTIATEQGEVRRITDTLAHDRAPKWSPDGKVIAFMSDRSGRDEIWLTDERGAPPRKLTDIDGEKGVPVWAPDSRALFFSLEEKLYRVSLEGKLEQVAAGGLDMQGIAPSPDGAWVAYATTTRENLVRVFVKPLAGGESRMVCRKGFVRCYSPVWTPNGKKLLFLASNGGAVDTTQAVLFALTLQREETNPSYRGVDAEADAPADAPPAPARGADARKVEVKIDWDGMERRIRPASRLTESIGAIAVAPDSRTYAVVAGGQIWSLDEEGTRSTRLTQPGPAAPAGAPEGGGPPSGLRFSRDGRTMFFREGSGLYSVPATPPPAAAPGAAAARRKVSFTARVSIDLREQRRYVFHEAWRTVRNRYWNRALNGVDWEAVRKQYEPLLQYVEDQEALADLLRQMIGELNTSHTSAIAPLPPGRERAGSGHPGFELAPDEAGYYRIGRVLKNGPADRDYIRVHTGDYLLAIDGQPLRSGENHWQALRRATGRSVELTLNSKPSAEGAWNARITPSPDSRTLYYNEWVEQRKAMVDKLSGGDFAYIHLRIMTPDVLNEFEEQLFEARFKKGVVLDVRFNGGGNLEMQLLKTLTTRHYMTLITGRGAEFPRPFRGFYGAMVVVQNENSGSNAEMFSEGVRALGLGKLVGMPTPGYVLLSSEFAMSDGLRLLIGHGHIETLKGVNMENNGVVPDVLVDNTPADYAAGRDRQLERAVETLRAQARPGR